MNFSLFWQIMHRAGRTGPEHAIGSPDLDRSFFVGLVPLEVDGMASWSSVASCLSRARRLSTLDGFFVRKSTVACVMETSILGIIFKLHINTVFEVLSHVSRLTLQPEPRLYACPIVSPSCDVVIR